MKLEQIPANSIIITPSTSKKQLLKIISKKQLTNIKIITIEELRKKIYFDYDEQTIYYLMEKYNYQIDVAKMYISKMYEVKENDFGSKKIKKIIDLKRELTENNLLHFSKNFIDFFKKKTILLYECTFLNKIDKNMLDEISNHYKIENIDNNKKNYIHSTIYELNTIEEEIIYVATKICLLFQKNININQIKLCGATGEYLSIIKRIFSWYNIPITFQDNYLYSTPIAQEFLKNLDSSGKNALKVIENKFSLTNTKNLEIYNKIINILNKYAWTDNYLKIKSFLESDFKSTTINNIHFQEEVEIINDLSNTNDENHIFLVGFNQGEIPKAYKDESYFNDELKQKLGLETTTEINQKIYKKWLSEIQTTKNLTITTKLSSSLGVHYLSSLNDDLKLEIQRPILEYNYSKLHNRLLLGEKLDAFIKYGEKEPDLELLYSNYPDISYLQYSNNYQGIDKEKLKKYLKGRLILSYSSMNTYYQCGFRYYLANILKLNIYEETFYTILGNLFHYILSISLEKDINLKEEYQNYLAKCTYEFNSREKFFLTNLEKELEFIINIIKKQNELTTFSKTYYEEKIEIDKSKLDYFVTFKGFVDKIMTDEKDDVIAIIDYKTGSPDLNLNNVIYGLDLQLPVYIYLARTKLPHASIAGFYLQKILNNEISKDHKHSYETLKEEKLKLQGYSNSNTSVLEKFDPTYNESQIIKGMRTTSKGLGTKKVLTSEQIDKLESITEEKIDDVITKIINAEFQINPKRIGMNNIGCKYCNFKDICFCNESNIETLKEYKNMEFLGGELNDSE